MTAYVCSGCRNHLSRTAHVSWYHLALPQPLQFRVRPLQHAATSARSLHTPRVPLFDDDVADGSDPSKHRSARKRDGRRVKYQAEEKGEDFLLDLFNENTQIASNTRKPKSSSRPRTSTAPHSQRTVDKDNEPRGLTHVSAEDILHQRSTSSQRSVQANRKSRGNRTDSIKADLTKYLENKDARGIESLWRDVQDASERDKIKISASMYDRFLMAFLSLGLSERAIEVWNHRAKAGIAPSIATWDAMLRGAGFAKDADALNEVWTMMLRSGTKPDKQMWATKIHGLATMGHWRSAFETFEEMAQIWLQEAQTYREMQNLESVQSLGDINGVLKPDIRSLNALLSALARANQSERVANALSIARSLGIGMDVYSFNSLLLLASRSHDKEMMDRFLEQMQLAQVKPDTATYTIILDSIYRGEESAAQQDRAAAVLNQMVDSGIEANSWVYSTLIKSLLKANGNLAGAQAVLGHMDRHQIPINTHIFTAFATYYFEQSPPDMAAIETLWNRALSASHLSGSRLDVVFFDRLIEGFAKQDEIGKATTALAEASKRGIVPGWLAMTELLRALARIGDWSRMRELVAEALGDRGSEMPVKRDFGRQQFLEIARELGLLDGTEKG